MSATYVRVNKPKMIALLSVGLAATKQAVRDSTARCKDEYRAHLRAELKKTDASDWSPETLAPDQPEASSVLEKLLGVSNHNKKVVFTGHCHKDNSNLVRKWLVYLQAQAGDVIVLPEGLYMEMLDFIGQNHVLAAMDDAMFGHHAEMACNHQLGKTCEGEPLRVAKEPSPITGPESLPNSPAEVNPDNTPYTDVRDTEPPVTREVDQEAPAPPVNA